jgi:hypothetical protein
MTVVITLDNGESYMLDRGLIASNVAERINAARGGGELIPFENNATPSRTFYVDPDHVIAIVNDGHAY